VGLEEHRKGLGRHKERENACFVLKWHTDQEQHHRCGNFFGQSRTGLEDQGYADGGAAGACAVRRSITDGGRGLKPGSSLASSIRMADRRNRSGLNSSLVAALLRHRRCR